MRANVSENETEFYRNNGFLAIEAFLSDFELADCIDAVEEALRMRGRFLLPDGRWEENEQSKQHVSPILTQRINLWRTSARIKKLILNHNIGRIAAQLSGMLAVRLWADQALIKQPFSPPTGFHLDTPFWSFTCDQALSIWIALDQTTLKNGAMCYIPGVHKHRRTAKIDLGGDSGALFKVYPEWALIKPQFCPIRAGGCIFHNGLLAHGAAANMTPQPRRAMTAIFYPDGATFNGTQNILSDEQVGRLKIGDLLNDDESNPIIFSSLPTPSAGEVVE